MYYHCFFQNLLNFFNRVLIHKLNLLWEKGHHGKVDKYYAFYFFLYLLAVGKMCNVNLICLFKIAREGGDHIHILSVRVTVS